MGVFLQVQGKLPAVPAPPMQPAVPAVPTVPAAQTQHAGLAAKQATELTLDALAGYSWVSIIEVVALAGIVAGLVYVLAEKVILGTKDADAKAKADYEEIQLKRAVTREELVKAQGDDAANDEMISTLTSLAKQKGF